MSDRSRIPTIAAEIAAYMDKTDNYQLALAPIQPPAPAPALYNWQRWHWTSQESADYHAFRLAYDANYALHSDKQHVDTEVRDEALVISRNIHSYDNDKDTGHHLLDKVALFGTLTDCETFNVKKGTALATSGAATTRTAPAKVETVSVKENKHLLTRLLVVIAGQKGKGKPKGIKEIMMFKATTALKATAPALSAYEYVGDVKRGYINVTHTEADLDKAWFVARLKDNKGAIGQPSAAVGVNIMRD
ncbi:MAG TPA: hypothetical protein VF411_03280 [Bacteroidia bacterium]